MDNKERENKDRDKILEDILNKMTNENKNKSSSSYAKSRKSDDSNNKINKPVNNDMSSSNNAKLTDTSSYSKFNNIADKKQTSNIPVNDINEKVNNTDKTDISTQGKEQKDVYYDKRENSSRNNNRKRNKHKNKKRRSKLPFVLMLTVVIFTIAICLSIVIITVGRDMLAIGKDETVKIITIPENATTDDISQILYDEGIIKIPRAFKIISKMSSADTKYIAGEHAISPSMAYETIIKELTTDAISNKETVSVTFIEGTDIYSAASLLEENGVCSAERFLYYFNAGDLGYNFETKLPVSTGLKFCKMEGYLFPDTYTFYLDMEPELVCRKIYKNFDEKITEKYYDRMEKMDMTLDEVITLASIVQAEAPHAEDMKKVASVFHNRLADKETFPKLESDPTRKYVDNVIKPNIDISSEAMYEAYNTYEGNGLPPGAIGNPGIAAIEAVLYPADTMYYFFCANVDTKEIFYAETNDEHEENLNIIKQQQKDAKKK